MKHFKFEPVRWMSIILAVLTALLGANEVVDRMGYADIIPSSVMPWCLFAEALLAILLGEKVRNRVTPLAQPRDSSDRPLVPLPAGPVVRAPKTYKRDVGLDLIPPKDTDR